jgi:hypothetical protein
LKGLDYDCKMNVFFFIANILLSLVSTYYSSLLSVKFFRHPPIAESFTSQFVIIFWIFIPIKYGSHDIVGKNLLKVMVNIGNTNVT